MKVNKKQRLETMQMTLDPRAGFNFNRKKLDPYLIETYGTIDIMNLIYDKGTDSFKVQEYHEKS